jgi:hypothetical protein
LAERSASAAEQGQKEATEARAVAENRLGLARRSAEDLVKLIAADLRSVQGIQIKTLERDILQRFRVVALQYRRDIDVTPNGAGVAGQPS